MRDQKPSRTALRVAIRRAEHQILDDPRVFDDPLALSIIGPEASAGITSGSTQAEHIASRTLRAFVVARSRYAEDELANSVERGIQQYVVLGAGLDTFAFRNPYPELRVFEVDHPSTQRWKLDQLQAAGIPVPAGAILAPIDFECESLADALRAAGFRSDQSAFFAWLGVTPYLTEQAFLQTLGYIGGLPPGSGVVFDYAVSRASLGFLERRALDALADRVASAGEPFQLFFEPVELASRVRESGFHRVEDLGPGEINARYFAGRADGLRVRGGLARLLSAKI